MKKIVYYIINSSNNQVLFKTTSKKLASRLFAVYSENLESVHLEVGKE